MEKTRDRRTKEKGNLRLHVSFPAFDFLLFVILM
jgi:hypothetical protein